MLISRQHVGHPTRKIQVTAAETFCRKTVIA